MLRPILMGLVAGQRSMTPLAALAGAARNGNLPYDNGPARLMSHPLIAAGGVAMAALEMAGDKMKTAPDRIVPIGLVVRSITSAYAGAALAPRGERVAGAALAVVAALGASYVGWRMRCAAMEKYGQTATGAVEDAAVLGSGLAIALTPS